MRNTDYLFVSLLFGAFLLVGVFLLVRVPTGNPVTDALNLEATGSAIRVSEIAPIKGKVEGGDQVVITGENLPEEAEVLFGSQLALEVKREEDGKTLVATTPATSAAGMVPVWVIAPNGGAAESPVGFFYLNQ